MGNQRNRTIMIGTLLAACAFSCVVTSDERPHRGNPIEAWEAANNNFKIRITAYDERGALLSGTYYVFASGQVGSDNWTEFMTVRHDDRPEIPREQVRFLSNEIGYIFMAWKYAVTRDGGKTWFVWDAEKDLATWRCCNYRLISEVQIGIDGIGTMKLNLVPGRDESPTLLQTKDYGVNWTR